MKSVFLLFIIYSIKLIEGAKILALMPIASPSHHIWNSALTNELVKRGHEVTYFSPDKEKNPKIRQILIEDLYPKLYSDISVEAMVEKQGLFHFTDDFDTYGQLNCQFVLESKAMDKLLEIIKKETFDLIIFDITLTECVYPVADELKGTPIVGVSAFGGSETTNYLTGNPESLAIRPNTFLLMPSENMTLFERIQNVLAHYYVIFDRLYNYLPKQEELVRTRFPNAKNLFGTLDRLSLILINNHFSIDTPLPTVPAIIRVGGLQIRPPQPLPEDLQKFLDESTHGAILLSLGTNVQSSKLSEEKRKILLDSLSELSPIRVLWKFEKDLPGKPDNVMIKSWLPQSDILAHPNVRLFFTHSGLLSTQEAIYHGKPIIGMPFLLDQFINVNKCVREGLGERIDFLTLSKENLVKTIKKVWNDSKYTERAQLLSKVFKDQPETPLERAVWWIEYVIRHKGAPHLRSPSLNLAWYQNNLLDVYLILLTASLVALYVIVRMLKSLLRCVGLLGSSKSGRKLKSQ